MLKIQTGSRALRCPEPYPHHCKQQMLRRTEEKARRNSAEARVRGDRVWFAWRGRSPAAAFIRDFRQLDVAAPSLLRRFLGALLPCLMSLLSATWIVQHAVAEPIRAYFSDDVTIQGNRFFGTERLLSEIESKPNSFPSKDLLEGNIDRILTLYEENGFPYCQVSPSHFKITDEGRLSFSFLVEEGPRVKVNQIQLRGLKATKKDVILRELGRGIFGFFSQSRVNASLRRIERLSYIKEINETQLLAGSNPEEGILKVSLVEDRNNGLSGILGYAPGARGRKGSLYGKMELVFDNIFGTGRMAQWNWSKKGPHSSGLSFLYREPWVLGFPPTLELRFSQVDCDSTYLQLSVCAKLIFNSTGRLSWGVEGGWEKVVPGTAEENRLPMSTAYKMGAVFSLDLLDYPGNPRRGLFYKAEMSYSQKRNHSTPSFTPEKRNASVARIFIDLNYLFPTAERQTFFVGLHFKGLNTNQNVIPLPDQFKLGGINSIRGYREEEFLGTLIVWSNLEYRFLLGRNSRIFLFSDYGYFQRKTLLVEAGECDRILGGKLSYGLGLRMDSKVGSLGIDYGLGEGDSFSRGNIHFGITNRF